MLKFQVVLAKILKNARAEKIIIFLIRTVFLEFDIGDSKKEDDIIKNEEGLLRTRFVRKNHFYDYVKLFQKPPTLKKIFIMSNKYLHLLN